MRVLTSFDLWSNLGLTKGFLVILAKRGTSGASMLERVAQRHFVCSRGPKGHQIAHGPRPDLETQQPIGLMGSPAHCY